MLVHDVQINTQYKRLLQRDAIDVEDLALGTRGVIKTTTTKPIAVYKDDGGEVHGLSALCTHFAGSRKLERCGEELGLPGQWQ